MIIDVANTEVKDLHKVFKYSNIQDKQAEEEGTAWVLRSLTPNHRGILALILENTTAEDSAIAFDALFDQARDAMLASTEAALRSHLVELVDHGIIRRKGAVITLLLPRDVVQTALAAV